VAIEQFTRRLRKLFQQFVFLRDAVTILDGGRIGHGWTGSERVGCAVRNIRHQQRNLLRRRRGLRQPSAFHRGQMFAHGIDLCNGRAGKYQSAIGRNQIVQ